jgi:hypothetical protein
MTCAVLQGASSWWALVAVLFATGCLVLVLAIVPEVRRRWAYRQARRHDANARALLQVAEALQANALSLWRCGLGAEAEAWARLCRQAAHDRLAVINDLLLLSMHGRRR